MFGIPIWLIASIIFVFLMLSGISFIRPTHRALVERYGKYNRYGDTGFVYAIPGFEKIVLVNTTQQLVELEPQTIITKDKLNAKVDAQIYFKVSPTEDSVKDSQYNVDDYQFQIVQLARTNLRNIIGTLSLRDANIGREKINGALANILRKEAKDWGVEIVRAELKEIDAPENVQHAMNEVVIAETNKIAAIDNATAAETEADGKRRAAIKEAQGIKQANILEAEGQAAAIKLVNESARKYFRGNAQILKRLEVTQSSLENNTKYVIPDGKQLVNVIGDSAGVIPIKRN